MSPPPGYVAYGGQGAAMSGPMAKLGGITKALVIMQGISVGVSALLLLLQLGLVGKADDLVAGRVDVGEFDDSLAPFVGVSLLMAAVSIAILVLLIIWSYRMAGNLIRLGRSPIVWKPGLTIVVWILGGCTLSIINFLMLREHWKGSDPDVAAGDQGWRNRPVSPLIVGWFALALGQVALGMASGIRSFSGVNVGGDSESVAESLSDRLPLVLASGAAGLAAGVLLIMIVRQLAARHMAATREA